jgi:hypothetical protein
LHTCIKYFTCIEYGHGMPFEVACNIYGIKLTPLQDDKEKKHTIFLKFELVKFVFGRTQQSRLSLKFYWKIWVFEGHENESQ